MTAHSSLPFDLPAGVSVQDRYAPTSHCFGCGPSNDQGLRLKSYVTRVDPQDPLQLELTADFEPAPHHEAFDGIVNGGIVGALLDCHSAWTTAIALLVSRGSLDPSSRVPPIVVTADFHVRLQAPTPSRQRLQVFARPRTVEGRRCTVEAELRAGSQVTARCTGTFVAVRDQHPARRKHVRPGG